MTTHYNIAVQFPLNIPESFGQRRLRQIKLFCALADTFRLIQGQNNVPVKILHFFLLRCFSLQLQFLTEITLIALSEDLGSAGDDHKCQMILFLYDLFRLG